MHGSQKQKKHTRQTAAKKPPLISITPIGIEKTEQKED